MSEPEIPISLFKVDEDGDITWVLATDASDVVTLLLEAYGYEKKTDEDAEGELGWSRAAPPPITLIPRKGDGSNALLFSWVDMMSCRGVVASTRE